MIIETTGVKITETEIEISGNNLETILVNDNLFEDMESEPVTFVFPRAHQEGGMPAMKYLYRVVTSNKKCKEEKSFGEMIEKLASGNCIISLSENFLQR
jgi:hypothetical protein